MEPLNRKVLKLVVAGQLAWMELTIEPGDFLSFPMKWEENPLVPLGYLLPRSHPGP